MIPDVLPDPSALGARAGSSARLGHPDWATARSLAHAEGLDLARRLPVESLPVPAALGRVLAHDVVSGNDLPGFTTSAMDGWAIRGAPPWTVGPSVRTGSAPEPSVLEVGTARPISTGGAVPLGASAVLRSEQGRMAADADGVVRLHVASDTVVGVPREGDHLRFAGEEAFVGDVLIRSGRRLSPVSLGLAAAGGADRVIVHATTTVDLLVLGDEVQSHGVATPGRVRDALTPMIGAAVSAAGARPGRSQRVADDRDATVGAFRGASADVVVTTGGSSRGHADHVRSSLRALGARIVFDGVAIRPGHPVIFAVLENGRPFLCLPGNPLAALVCFASFGTALLDGAHGRPLESLREVVLATAVANPTGSTRLVPCSMGATAEPTRWQGSAMLRGVAEADLLAVVPPGGATRGQAVLSVTLPGW